MLIPHGPRPMPMAGLVQVIDEAVGPRAAALDAAGVATQGEPVLARYNAPFTPWFLRRNEIWLALR